MGRKKEEWNVPKVNYSYTDADSEWSPSGESKRKWRKVSR